MKKAELFTLTVAYYLSSAIAFVTMFIAVNNLDKNLLSTVVVLIIISNIWAAVSVYNLNIEIYTTKNVFSEVKNFKCSLIFWNLAIGVCIYVYLLFTQKTEIFLSVSLLTAIYFLCYLLSAKNQFNDNILYSCIYVIVPNVVKFLAVIIFISGTSSFEYPNLCFAIILSILLYIYISEYRQSTEADLINKNRDYKAELSYSISVFTNMLILYMPQFLSMNNLSAERTVSVLNSLVLVQASIVPLNTYLNRFWISSTGSNIISEKLNAFIISIVYGMVTAFIVVLVYYLLDRQFNLDENLFPVNCFLIFILPLKCAQQYLLLKSSIDGKGKIRLIADTSTLVLYTNAFLFIDLDFNKFLFVVFICEFFHLIVLAGLNVLSRPNRSL